VFVLVQLILMSVKRIKSPVIVYTASTSLEFQGKRT